ncbi:MULTISPECIES: PAS domain-containing sensor histidine kinase [unclassified Pseudomonas]|uniref:PAS domain-containing sensor histidine kinase n=1 Tax=unclassified Pseudomonas TaxID=196821 RepID=UPI00244B0D38|nr:MULTISPECIES: PAS domain-containing sensor histidine kinase [unclassified Pseudomonas]MDH0303381.1 PAS domain-containing protein [Pseudomonas sp. GD04091]MDH1984552.1 PAS domain-containing protein [Pseudomonas sp. GD03689]
MSSTPSSEQLQARIDELEARLARRDLELDCFQLLRSHMAEGFCVLEMLDGPGGPLSDYRYLLSNDACLQHTAHGKQMGQTVRELIPEEADAWVSRFAEVVRTGRPSHFEQRLKVTDRLLTLSAHRLGPANDRRVAVLFTGVPASEQARNLLLERANKRVGETELNNKLLGELVDHSLANVFAADSNMRLVAINRTARETFERLHSFTPKIGDYVPHILDRQPEIMAKLEPVWPRMLAGEALVETVTLGPRDAPRHYDMRYNPLLDSDGRLQGGYLFAYDITERVKEQERLRQTEEALRQSQKMEAIGQLTGGIAHDFNNLLGGILGALELADKRLVQGRQQDSRHMLGIVRQNASRAASLIQRLLAFARQQTLLPQPVDVHHLVASMHELIQSSIDSHIAFVDATLAGQWLIRVDPPQLESTLLNLCINARDSMTRGGTLRIGCNNCTLDAAQAAELQLPPGQYLHIQVDDTGCGMPEEVTARAIEPFFTTKPLGQGTGLGLSMAYGFVRQSAGQLLIDSQPGHGTRIHLYLPRDPQSPSSPPVAVVTPDSPKPHRLRAPLLLVEDQPTLRLVIRDVLEEQGFEVQAFDSGHAALRALGKGTQPGLLIIDIGLPGDVDGYQVANAYRALDEQLPILFITGYDGAIDSHALRSAQHTALLHKPFELALLSAQVEQLLSLADATRGPDDPARR